MNKLKYSFNFHFNLLKMSKAELVPEEKAGFVSAYSLKWLDYYFDLGSDITTEHIPKTIEQRDVEFIYEKLNSNWNAELSNNVKR